MRLSTLLVACAPALLGSGSPLHSQATRVSERFLPGEVTVWAFEQEGSRIGHCRSSYVGELDLVGVRAHHFQSEVRLELPVPGGILNQQFTADLWTDAEGHALLVDFRSRMGETYGGVRITFGEGKAHAVLQQGASEQVREVELPGPCYALANNFVGHIELAVALDPPAPGESSSYSMFSVNTLQVFPFSVREDEEGGGALLHDSLGEVLHLDPEGKLELVEIPAAQLVLRRAEENVERFELHPPTPASRPDLDRQEVLIEEGDVRIAGTVTRPRGAEGRLPGVFFVSGSGVQDREGFSSGIDLGTGHILDRLTQEGFCVLRVDDRSAGQSSPLPDDATFDDLVEDARRALRFLRARDDVDPDRVFVIGHSEGGQTAPLLAAQEEGLAGIVLMAAPGRGVLELLREQVLRGARLSGMEEEERTTFAEQLDHFLLAVASGDDVEAGALPDELRAFASAVPWLRSHAAQDPLANIARVPCPVLILQGARDIQVSHERDAPALLEALELSGHSDHELIVFPELDHLFKRSAVEEATGLEYFSNRPVDEGFLERLVHWLEAHSQPQDSR